MFLLIRSTNYLMELGTGNLIKDINNCFGFILINPDFDGFTIYPLHNDQGT